jgi:hypothetical protein
MVPVSNPLPRFELFWRSYILHYRQQGSKSHTTIFKNRISVYFFYCRDDQSISSVYHTACYLQVTDLQEHRSTPDRPQTLRRWMTTLTYSIDKRALCFIKRTTTFHDGRVVYHVN